jgi:hypothetical protein
MIDLHWQGPFRWPKGNDADPVLKTQRGVYIHTMPHRDGYLVYCAGLTRHPFAKRFSAHTREYNKGAYTIFDVAALKDGVRKEIWHGLWAGHNSPERQAERDQRIDELRTAARELMDNWRVFVVSVDPVPRILERLEASVMEALYSAPGYLSQIPDRGDAPRTTLAAGGADTGAEHHAGVAVRHACGV